MSNPRVDALAARVADYVATHQHYATMTKRDAIIAAVRVLATDEGAAADYMATVADE